MAEADTIPFEVVEEIPFEVVSDGDAIPFEVVEETETPSLRPEISSPFATPKALPQRAQSMAEVEMATLQDRRKKEVDQWRADAPNHFTPEEIKRIESGGFADFMMNPPPGMSAPHVTGEELKEKFPSMSDNGAKILAGVLQTGAGAWNFMASPMGIGMTGAASLAGLPGVAGAVGKGTLATFAVDALKNTPGAIDSFNKAVESGDAEKIAQTASALALNTFVAVGAGRGAISSAKAIPAQERGASQAAQPAKTKEQAVQEAVREEMAPLEGDPMGIRPPGSEYMDAAIEAFTPVDPKSPPAIRIERGARVPRLQPYETEKMLASSPEGMARVPGLGTLVDPRSQAKTDVDVAIITRAYSTHKGRTLAALWAQTQHRAKDLFKADSETGTIELTNGERGYISDVIEAEMRNPGSQSISEAQRDWINNEWKPLREDVNKMLEREGVKEVVTEELEYEPANDYFPRPAIGKRNRPEAQASGQTGSRPGAAPFFEKSRKYATEFEGARPPIEGEAKEQIIYDQNAISRATKFISGAYKAVADHRLANDKSLGGETVKERFESLRENSADRLSMLDEASRAEAEAQLHERAAYPVWGKEERLSIAPAFQNKIYPIENAAKLKKAYAEDVRGWVRSASNVTGAAKALMATADMSAPMIQGLAMMGRHPAGWLKSTINSYKALVDPNVVGKVLENPDYMRAAEEFTQSGGSLLQLEDFLSGKQSGAAVTKIPIYGKIVEATGRAYGAFLDLAKLEMWKSWAHVADRKDWGRVAESIENGLFMGRMEKIGLNPHRAVGERLMLFAPMYYRGAGGLISMAFQKGVQGKVARQMLTGYAGAGMLITVGSLLAIGMDWEDIKKRLDPTKGTFMKVPVESGDGKRVEVGIGNVITQLVRLVGQAADYHTSEKVIDTGVEDNPYLRFLRGRAAFLPSLAVDFATGRDYFGNRITMTEATARRFMPFVLQSMFPREELPMSQKLMDSAFSFFGLNAFPESEYAAQLRHMDDEVKGKTGKSFLELPLAERAAAVKDFKSRADYKDREPTMKDMERFIRINAQRELNVRNRISDDVRKLLDDNGLNVSGYKSTVTLNGVDVPLSHAEQIRYEELLAESYNENVPKVVKDDISKLTPAQREKWWIGVHERIRKQARTKLMSEMAKPTP